MKKLLLTLVLGLFLASPSYAALSTTLVKTENFGTLKAKIFELTFTGVTSGTVSTGLRTVLFCSFQNSSDDDSASISLNFSDVESTAASGSVHIAEVGSGDNGDLFCLGN